MYCSVRLSCLWRAGLLGYFRPSIPITAKDLEVRGMSGAAVLERLTGVRGWRGMGVLCERIAGCGL